MTLSSSRGRPFVQEKVWFIQRRCRDKWTVMDWEGGGGRRERIYGLVATSVICIIYIIY